MRVVMLSWEYPPRIVGGISPHVFELCPELVKRGIEVHVVTKSTPKAPDEETEATGVHVHRVHLEREPHNFVDEIQLLNKATDLKCRQLLESWRAEGLPTVFHAHDWLSLDAARELKYEYQLPMVATVHATEKGRHGGIHGDLSRYIHEQEYWLTYEAWRVIVCSQFMRQEVHNSFSCPLDKIDVVFNGVDASKFRFEATDAEIAEWRGRLARPDEKIVMYVGRFVREKGIHVLLNAASSVLAKQPETKFVIVGGGNRESLERFVRWYGLEEKVLFTGFMANRSLHQLYRVADVAVFPSLYEPFGIVALEGMAAGCAVVASDAGGLKEVVIHDVNGTSTYAGDAGSLAWGILKVLGDPKRADRLKQNADRRLNTDFHWKNLAEQTHRVYERVWREFLQSPWAARTLWPVTPGAQERAERLRVAEKAATGAFAPKSPSPVAAPEIEFDPDEAIAAGKSEELEKTESD
ncbi:MAG: glycosyltransferase family 4 protein [Fimbriimonadaceae bacterium]|nr:glycosyltransferase family 4 protein [Fimbriimonadaceae bacterium]